MTGKPIKFAGVGEKLEDFEPFHPERMASRILGMGDVVSLVEKAAEAVDLDDAQAHGGKDAQGPVHAGGFSRSIAPDEKARPAGEHREHAARRRGGAARARTCRKQEKEFKHMEAMICGMTPKERADPQILNASRRMRIAKGSGVSVTELNTMLNKFGQMQQMMKKMGKFSEDDGPDGRRDAGTGDVQAMRIEIKPAATNAPVGHP